MMMMICYHTGRSERDTTDNEGGDGDQFDSVVDRIVLFDREGEHSGSDPQGNHASPGEPQWAAGAESARECAVQARAIWRSA